MSDTNYKKIKIIGFDLDQTLYPKSPEIDIAIQKYIYEKISKKDNIDVETAKKRFDELYRGGKGISGSKTLIALGFDTDIAKNIVQEALENADIEKYLKPNKEILILLNKLKEKYKSIDILTGSNKNNAFIKLKKLEIPVETFNNILTSDDGSKSDLSLYKIWLDLYPNNKPEEFLYIGDRVSSDYEKPKELGIQSILVNIKTHDRNVDCLQLDSIIEIEKYLV